MIIGNTTLVFNKSIWYDEVYSLNLVKGNFAQIVSGTAQDVHPPLYYLILKLGLLIGNGLFGINVIYVAKFISIIPIFLTVPGNCISLILLQSLNALCPIFVTEDKSTEVSLAQPPKQ